MERSEFCELWWSGRGTPLLTFYGPTGGQTFVVGQDPGEDHRGMEMLEGAMAQLGLSGWELVSVSGESGGMFFKRRVQ